MSFLESFVLGPKNEDPKNEEEKGWSEVGRRLVGGW